MSFSANVRPLYWSILIILWMFSLVPCARTQTRWFKYEGNPVLDLGPSGSWDDDWIHIDRVILIDSIYHMWYTGGWREAQIGHATSSDGITWKRDKRNPVLRARPGTWEANVTRPYVTHSGSRYHMWYTGDNVATFRIGYATAVDGVRWKRYRGNPVLDGGGIGAWDEGFSGMPSLVGPDRSGVLRMWYQGNGIKIGFATATSETTWTKYPEPVFWGNDVAWYPRVLFTGGLYEMWCGTRDPLRPRAITGNPQPGVFAYATSKDGVHWIESSENPALRPGPDGTWDYAGLQVGDFVFDGQLYHMWYNGDDGTHKWRGGYAISPRGLSVHVSASNSYVKPGAEAVQIAVHLDKPEGLTIWGKIRSPIGRQNPESPIELLGMHQEALQELRGQQGVGASIVTKGSLTMSWIPTKETLYFVDLILRLKQKGIRDFELYKAATFTTIGPVECTEVRLLGDLTPHPGDTVLVKLTLRNKGLDATARSVAASLTSQDPSIASIAEFSSTYGDIPPGKTANTLGHYRILVNPYSPFEKEATVHISISSWGIPFWYGSFALHVVPPWWRTTWAYGAYVLLFVGVVGGTFRYIGVRNLHRKIRQLELLQNERARISQDMHDEVGATLTEIAILGEMAKKSPHDPANYLQQMTDAASKAIDSMGEIIWAMNPANDSLDRLVGHIRRDVTRSLHLANIRCVFTAPEALPSGQITSEVRRNVFLVVREAVHNAVKHSGATIVSVMLDFSAQRTEIVIADNGAGFDLKAAQATGNGLANMSKRMTDIGGALTVESHPGGGTRVTLSSVLPPRMRFTSN